MFASTVNSVTVSDTYVTAQVVMVAFTLVLGGDLECINVFITLR